MKEGILAMIVVGLVVAGLGGFYLYQNSGGPTSGSTTTAFMATNSALGIHLMVTLNSTTTQPGGRLGFQAFVYNDLGKQNNVSAMSNWRIPRLIMNPCGPIDAPVAVVTIQGRYNAANISSAPTPEFGPGCTTVAGGIKGYSFYPFTDSATVLGGTAQCEPSPCQMNVGFAGTSLGYLKGGQTSPFIHGIYTLVAEDEWGDVALATFIVT